MSNGFASSLGLPPVGGSGGGFSGLGGQIVAPGFRLKVALAEPLIQRRNVVNKFLQDLLKGGAAGLLTPGTGGIGAGLEESFLASALGDVEQEESQRTRELEARFGSLGRSRASTAFGSARRDIAEEFARTRLAARSQAAQLGSNVRTQLLQLLLGLAG